MNTAQMSAEQAADFAALNAAAMSDEAAIVEQMPEEQQGISEAAAWAMVPAMFGSILAMALPELKQVYSDDACQQWGAAMVPVADKYGWSSDGLLNSPEIALAVASLPFAIGTFQAIKSRKQVAEKSAPVESKEKPEKPKVNSPVDVVIG